MSPVVLGNRGHPELFSDVTCRIPTAFLVDAIIRDMLARMSQIQPLNVVRVKMSEAELSPFLIDQRLCDVVTGDWIALD